MSRPELIAGPYVPPSLVRGDRATCLYRDSDVVVTSWTAARIAWPRCRALGRRGGSGLLVDDELKRAVTTESAEAIAFWFGVSGTTVWEWRRAFGISRSGTEGSKRLYDAASERAGAAKRDKPLPGATRAKMRKAAAKRTDLRRLLDLAHVKRWEGKGWTAEQTALLGTVPDGELAALTGRTTTAVRLRRTRLGIASHSDGRRKLSTT